MSMPKDEIIKRLNVMESFINNIAGPWLWFRHFRNPWHSIKSIYLKKKSNLTGPSWHCGVDTPIILCTLWVQFRVKALGCVVASRSRAVHLAELPTFVRICCVAPGIQMKISQRKIRKRLLPRCSFTVRVTAVVVISHFIEIMFLGRIWWPHLD